MTKSQEQLENEELLDSETAGYSKENREKLKSLFEDKEFAQFLKGELLGGAMQHGSWEDIRDKTGMNWVLGVDTKMKDEDYARIIKGRADKLNHIAFAWNKLERVANKKEGAVKSTLNQAK